MSKQYEADSFIQTGGTSSQYLMADGTTSTGSNSGVDVGTGTANKVAKFSDSDTITDSTITDDGTDVSITGKLGIQTATPDSLIHIEHEDNNYDVSRGIHLDYTKDHTGTGWSAGIYGIRSTITHEGVGKTTDVTAGRFQALHEGTGTAYFLYGSSSRGTHNGSGNTGVIWGAYNQGHISGTGTGTHPYLIGTNQKAELDNANASVALMQGVVSIAKTNAGAITNRVVAGEFILDCDQGAATAVDASVLHLESLMGNLTTSGNSRTINSVSTLPSVFAGSIESPKFFIGTSEANYLEEDGNGVTRLYGDGGIIIATSDGVEIDISDIVSFNGAVEAAGSIQATSLIKDGGTSSQFLKADGSVDSSTYSTTDTQLTTEEVQDIVGAMVSSNTENLISVTYTDADGKLNFDAGASAITDYVSAANGGTFSGDITADSFIIAGGTSNRFLKADGSVDSNTYMTGAGSVGNIAYYSGTNAVTDTSKLAWDAIGETLDVDGDVDVTNDVNVTGNVDCNTIQAANWNYVPQIMQSNFSHTSGNGYMNMPFGNLGDNSNAGEQSFVLATFGGYVESFAMKNTATSTAMTGTDLAFRIRVNGVVVYTSSTQTFTAAARTYKGWALTSTDAVFNAGDDINFQFICTSGLWRDCTATIVTRCII